MRKGRESAGVGTSCDGCVCSYLGVLLCVHRMYSFLVYPCVCSCLVCDCVYTHVYTCVCVCHMGGSLAVLGP